MSSEEKPSDNEINPAQPAPEMQQQVEIPVETAGAAEEQKPESKDSELGKLTMREFISSIEPDFVDARTKGLLDQASGVPSDDRDDDDQQMMFGAGQGEQEPATVSILRERIQEYYEARAELNSLRVHPRYETLLVKEQKAKTQELSSKIERVYGEIVALADSYFNDPTKYHGPTVQHAFVVDPHPEVTVAKILDKIGMPQEPEEPEEFLNPSLIPAKAG